MKRSTIWHYHVPSITTVSLRIMIRLPSWLDRCEPHFSMCLRWWWLLSNSVRITLMWGRIVGRRREMWKRCRRRHRAISKNLAVGLSRREGSQASRCPHSGGRLWATILSRRCCAVIAIVNTADQTTWLSASFYMAVWLFVGAVGDCVIAMIAAGRIVPIIVRYIVVAVTVLTVTIPGPMFETGGLLLVLLLLDATRRKNGESGNGHTCGRLCALLLLLVLMKLLRLRLLLVLLRRNLLLDNATVMLVHCHTALSIFGQL